jgi:hypothetical protein
VRPPRRTAGLGNPKPRGSARARPPARTNRLVSVASPEEAHLDSAEITHRKPRSRTPVRLPSGWAERRKHYWNSRWGRLARQDILVSEDAGTWMVEAREGGADGKSRWFELPNENRAPDCVRDLISASGFDGWREL